MTHFKVLFFFLFNILSGFAQLKFEAKGILYLHDADFNTFSYGLGIIEKENQDIDKIGAFTFPLSLEETNRNSEKSLSNSILSTTRPFAVSTNSRICYVAETMSSLSSSPNLKNIAIKDLPTSSFISVVDVSNLKSLKLEYRFKVGAGPRAISLSKNSDYLLVASEQYNQEIQLYELDATGKPQSLLGKPSNIGNGIICDVQWHPGGDFAAYINKTQKEIGILKVIRDNQAKIIRLDLFGNPIKMEGDPSSVLFSKNGDFLYILDKRNEPNLTNIFDKGHIYTLKLNLLEPQGNVFLSKIEVDVNPTNMVMHPSGNYLIVSAMRKSFEYPVNDRNTGVSSLSVLQTNADGSLSLRSVTQVDGIMPLGMDFDKNGNNLALSCFQFMNFGKPMGGIEFFSFKPNQTLILERQNIRINTAKGIHALHVIEDF